MSSGVSTLFGLNDNDRVRFSEVAERELDSAAFNGKAMPASEQLGITSLD